MKDNTYNLIVDAKDMIENSEWDLDSNFVEWAQHTLHDLILHDTEKANAFRNVLECGSIFCRFGSYEGFMLPATRDVLESYETETKNTFSLNVYVEDENGNHKEVRRFREKSREIVTPPLTWMLNCRVNPTERRTEEQNRKGAPRVPSGSSRSETHCRPL